MAETGTSGTPSPLPDLREIVVSHLDMLMVDRLRAWALNILDAGRDIGMWGDPKFVAVEMNRIAADIEAVIKGTPILDAHATLLAEREALSGMHWRGGWNVRCAPCVTAAHCAHHRRCLAECVPRDLAQAEALPTHEKPVTGICAGCGHFGAHAAGPVCWVADLHEPAIKRKRVAEAEALTTTTTKDDTRVDSLS